jgi:putative thiamine transport system ATP-binding protein
MAGTMSLKLQDVSLRLRGRVLVKPFSLEIGTGEVVTLMGASGSGKSSILSFVGGDLAEAFAGDGEIELNGRRLVSLPPYQRRVARLFQDDLLFPHMTVGENLLFAIPQKADQLGLMRDALARADLVGFEDRPPHTLSGGQRSRVALMRALLAEPDAILLDEPFSKLDQDLRASMREMTYRHIAERYIPALLVTHDRADAPLGGRVLKLADGEVRDV